MALAPVSEEELAQIVQHFSSNKSNDVNYLSIWLIKRCFKHLLSPLTHLVNLSFQSGHFPSALKVAKVTPIFKKGDPNCIGNFRPISILPVFSKIFEKAFQTRMLNFLEKHNILSKNQFGFRQGKSTIDAVVSLVEMVVECLERRQPTLSVFLDLSKAFDCVDHSILLQKLEFYGIRGVPHSWLKSYLNNRSQTVQIANKLSKFNKLSYGVPQGSILSPILFLIYVNDTASSLRHGRLVQYADDTTLCFSRKTKLDLEIQTFYELNNCIQHFNDLNLSTNHTKSNFISYCLRPAYLEHVPTVMLEETEIEEVHFTKFLGIHLDRGLTWINHIDSICNKLSSGIYVLRTLSKYCPNQVLMTAYYGLIYPHLSYGVVLWGSCANAEFMRLFRLQKKAVRIICKLKNRESCRTAFKTLQLLTLPCIYILETTTYCMTKCSLTRGTDIHNYETRGRGNYRTGQHRTVVYEHLPSQVGVHLFNSLPKEYKSAKMPKAFRARLKNLLTSQAFYSVGEFLVHDWELH